MEKVKVLDVRSNIGSASSKWAYLFERLLKDGRTWAFKANAIALYDTGGLLIKTLSPVSVSFSIVDSDRQVEISAQDTSTDSYTTDRVHVMCVDSDGYSWSAFRATASASVTKGSTDTLQAFFRLRIPIAAPNASGLLARGAELVYLDLSGGAVSQYAPVNALRIRLLDGTTQDFTNITKEETAGTMDGVPYYGVKVSAVDTSPDAKNVDTIKVLGGGWELAQYYYYYLSKPSGASATWYAEARFKYRYTVTSSGVPGSY
jgi:hypothetical protein